MSSIHTGFPLWRSNVPDPYGFHDWSEYTIHVVYSVPFLHPSTLHYGNTDAFVDVTGIVSTFPRNLCLCWMFWDPNSGDTKVLYEVVAGVRYATIPARYVPEVADDGTTCGPMMKEWFLDMVSQFTVSTEGKLLKDGLKVCQIWEDFEWMATVMLPTQKDVNLTLYTAERLVYDVRNKFSVWHLDSFNRATALIAQFNSISPTLTDSMISSHLNFNFCMHLPLLIPPPPPFSTIPPQDCISTYVTPLSVAVLPLEDYAMDSEDGI
ncbi:hypothetical protein GGU10DRAFT_381830 [Lentinula aff. detonsa]|uniref:Uncharacterized protein n=1 Tax=Lentinula aff. detonsa TaxID=2804958 RepID=A0AA38NAZ9_9AGAR|nr:hypothetical protein GGU10DRAFT_381830 [Lentinula aff. detonsa]